MIHAFNFYCNRDLDLSLLMVETFNKHCRGSISISNTDVTPQYKSYGNGSGWAASMMKLNALYSVLRSKNVQDNDFILSVDSDVVFTSPEVFGHVKTEYGIIGTKHRPEYSIRTGKWSHMSGALIFFRGDIARKMCALTEEQLTNIRFKHFKPFNITENEDVVLSYLAFYVGANQFDLGTIPGISSGNFEGDCVNGQFAPFYHLNYCPTQFLGEQVTGKWDIPKTLKKKQIEL